MPRRLPASGAESLSSCLVRSSDRSRCSARPRFFYTPMSECRYALRPWDDAWNRPGMHRQGDSEMSPDTSRARTETEIRTLLDGHAAALRAKDPEGVVAHHAADFIQFSLAPPLRWKGANKSGLAAWFSTWNGPLEIGRAHV